MDGTTAKRWLLYTAVFCALKTTRIQSAEILVIFPTTAQSHYRVVRPLIHGLLDRGHKVLSITNFPDVDERANLSHINISGFKPHSKITTVGVMRITNVMNRLVGNADIYSTILGIPSVVNLLQSGRKFDLVIAEFFSSTPMFSSIATIVDAPIIGVCPMATFPWVHDLMGVETKLSYMPNLFNAFVDYDTSFFKRLASFSNVILYEAFVEWVYGKKIEEINQRHYGLKTESLVQSMANISLIFINTFHSSFMPLPRVPGIVEVGGIHVTNEKPLSQDLSDFINDAEHGVILFSLGTVVSESSLGIDKLNNIFETFSKLKQKVIMKFDAKKHQTLPSNVKVVKWFPQRDLLAHPKVLLFVSHAGLMSVIETIHCGKPMVAIPMFGDQPFNAHFLVQKQTAVVIDNNNLESNNLLNAINEALSENYRIKAKKLQELYNDRPQSSLETAIYWTEYIIRNKNESTQLLKSPKIHLNFYQTYLIDIFSAIILPIIISICLLLWTISCLKK